MNLNINNNKTLRYSITTQAMNINFLTHTHTLKYNINLRTSINLC